MTLAPVALFACHRPEHVRRTLDTLRACPEAAATELFIFADAARTPDREAAVAATRAVLRQTTGFARVEIVERATNWGLARSIIAGVDQLCASHGRVIVVEDDLILSPLFLTFMNDALDRYADAPRVAQVAGYLPPIDTDHLAEDALFLPLTTSWGWATWARAWQSLDRDMTGYPRLEQDAALRHRFDLDGRYPYFEMLCRQREGKVDPWAIRWYLTCFLRDALIVYPRQSLVSNGGMDGSGTHCGAQPDHPASAPRLLERPVTRWPGEIAPSPLFAAIKDTVGAASQEEPPATLARRLARAVKRLARRMTGKR